MLKDKRKKGKQKGKLMLKGQNNSKRSKNKGKNDD
jgi:hypothetical protein